MAEDCRDGKGPRPIDESPHEESERHDLEEQLERRARLFIPSNLAPPVDAAVVANLRDGSDGEGPHRDGSARKADTGRDRDIDKSR